MSNVNVVPWICREEWELCRDNLYGEDFHKKVEAVDHLYTWKMRCENLPLAVECTLILMDTYVQERRSNENQNNSLNIMSFELMYSMAITKFVNFVTDSTVGNKSTNTLQQMANQLGIPDWIVDIRHKAAHSQTVTSFSKLREGLNFCLQWLRDNYWSNGEFADISCDRDESDEAKETIELLFTVKKYLSNGAQKIFELRSDDRNKLYYFFCEKNTLNPEHFAKWSLQETCKTLIKKLSRMVKRNAKLAEYVANTILNSEQYLMASDTLNSAGELDRDAAKKWSEILSLLCSVNAESCFHLLHGLVRTATSDVEPLRRKNCAAVCLNEIFANILLWRDADPEAVDDISSKSTGKGGFRLRRSRLSGEDALTLLHVSVENPNKFVQTYLNNLMKIQKPPLSPEKMQKLHELIEIYTGKVKAEAAREAGLNTREAYTLQSLAKNADGVAIPCESSKVRRQEEEDKEHANEETMVVESDEEMVEVPGRPWRKCKGYWNWSETPLGVLPWQKFEFQPWLKIYESGERFFEEG